MLPVWDTDKVGVESPAKSVSHWFLLYQTIKNNKYGNKS